jgi:hypothetical protein
MKTLIVSVALAAIALGASPAADAQQPTEDVVGRYIELCGWLTDVKYSIAQQRALRAQVVSYWHRSDHTRMDNVMRSLKMHDQLAKATPRIRETTLAKVRPGILVSLQEDAAKGGQDSAWLYQQFLLANPPLAQGRSGSVPLTRDMVDAAIDYEHFMHVTVLNRSALPAAKGNRQAAYKAAARDYPRLSVEQQLEIAAQPGRLVEARSLWLIATPQVRAHMRARMGGQLTGEDHAHLSQFQQAQSGAGWAGVQSQINAMNQDSQTIMGSGTTWNSALGRWEQKGGIITEYDNGAVRVP